MITLIDDTAFSRMTIKTHRHNVKATGIFTIYELRTVLKAFATQCSEKGLSEKISDKDIQKKILTKLHDLVYAFRKTLSKELLFHRSYDLKIELKEGFEPPFGLLYKLSQDELETL